MVALCTTVLYEACCLYCPPPTRALVCMSWLLCGPAASAKPHAMHSDKFVEFSVNDFAFMPNPSYLPGSASTPANPEYWVLKIISVLPRTRYAAEHKIKLQWHKETAQDSKKYSPTESFTHEPLSRLTPLPGMKHNATLNVHERTKPFDRDMKYWPLQPGKGGVPDTNAATSAIQALAAAKPTATAKAASATPDGSGGATSTAPATASATAAAAAAPAPASTTTSSAIPAGSSTTPMAPSPSSSSPQAHTARRTSTDDLPIPPPPPGNPPADEPADAAKKTDDARPPSTRADSEYTARTVSGDNEPEQPPAAVSRTGNIPPHPPGPPPPGPHILRLKIQLERATKLTPARDGAAPHAYAVLRLLGTPDEKRSRRHTLCMGSTSDPRWEPPAIFEWTLPAPADSTEEAEMAVLRRHKIDIQLFDAGPRGKPSLDGGVSMEQMHRLLGE